MDNNFKLEIISPEKIVFSGDATSTTIPAYEGVMSILKNHIPIITFLRPGVIKAQIDEGNIKEFFVQDGTIEYNNDTLVILSASAISVKDLTKDFMEELNKDTMDRLSKKDITDHERYTLNHKLDIIKEIRV